MGKAPLLFLCLLGILSPAPAAAGGAAGFEAALRSGDLPRAAGILESWKKESPGDPELPAATGDYLYANAREGQSDLNPPADDELRVRPRCPPGADVRRWVTWRTSPARRRMLKRAGEAWRRALRLQPDRLDLYFDLAHLEQDLGDYPAQDGVLMAALEYADKHPGALRWKDGAPLPLPPSELFPRFLQASVVYYCDLRPVDPEKILRLTRMAQTFYPDDPYAYNSLAVFFSLKKDWQRTLKYLLLANRQAPRDSLVLLNMAETLEEMGKKREARIYYRKVLALHNDPACVARARAAEATLLNHEDTEGTKKSDRD